MITSQLKYTTKLDRIFSLYKEYGDSPYTDDISQLQHALQTVFWAEKETTDVSILFAAFIHDIGHIIPDAAFKGQFGVIDHHKIGSNFLLNLGIKHIICDLVQLHVDAKRYLATSNNDYFDNLSDISILTLALQGGLMHLKEANRFSNSPYFSQSIQLRTWDDKANDPELWTPDFDYYQESFNQNIFYILQ